MSELTPICPYCKQFSKSVTGKEIYPHRKDLFNLVIYSCLPCNAYVGTHKGTTKPLGRLANKELRKAKSAAHRAFDPLWKLGGMKRKEAYKWLAETLDVEPIDCHIGMFDVETCEDVVMHSLNKQEDLCEW
tara:strand:- start:175 stop:567 length:393 start_codon:yes stop_codon:yes gene_type:complete